MRDLRRFDAFRQPEIEAVISQGRPVPLDRLLACLIKVPTGILKVIATIGDGWDHVSVSIEGEDRCPTWDEMDRVYKLFFKSDETAMQLHVPDADHVNYHPYTLHLWRPLAKLKPIPRPPSIMVGPKPTGRTRP